MIVGQIFIGFGAYPTFIIVFVLDSDFCNDKLRQVNMFLNGVGWYT